VKILVAGIGNLFFGDDGFGCAVASAMAARPAAPGVVVRDFGIRGLDLAYELTSGYDAAILVDAAARGRRPGELFVLEPSASAKLSRGPLDAHALTPDHVLSLARSLGGDLPVLRLVGCEPAELGTEDEPAHGLSASVSAAVPAAIVLVEEVIDDLTATLAPAGGASRA
jgi:hydrogenase maturation protease